MHLYWFHSIDHRPIMSSRVCFSPHVLSFLMPKDRQSLSQVNKEALRDVIGSIRQIDFSRIETRHHPRYIAWLRANIKHMHSVARVHLPSSPSEGLLALLYERRFLLREFIALDSFLHNHPHRYFPLAGVERLTIHQLDAASIEAPDVVDLRLVAHHQDPPCEEEETSILYFFEHQTPLRLASLTIEQCSQGLWDQIMAILTRKQIRLREIHLPEHHIRCTVSTQRYLERHPPRLVRITSDPYFQGDQSRDALLDVFLRHSDQRLREINASVLAQEDFYNMARHPIEILHHQFPSRIKGQLTQELARWTHLHTLEIPLRALGEGVVFPPTLRTFSLGHGHNMMDVDPHETEIFFYRLMLAIQKSSITNLDLAGLSVNRHLYLPLCQVLRQKTDLEELSLGDLHGIGDFTTIFNILGLHSRLKRLRCWITFPQIRWIVAFLLQMSQLVELEIIYAYQHPGDHQLTNQDMLHHVHDFIHHFVMLDVRMPHLRILRIILNLDNQPIFTPELGQSIHYRCPILHNLCIGW